MTTQTAETLTADDLKALRQADSIVFAQDDKNGPRIRAIREYREDEVSTLVERRLFPVRDTWPQIERRERVVSDCVSGQVYAWTLVEEDGFGGRRFGGTGFSMIHTAKFDRRWKTALAMLKVGDSLTLDFGGDRFSSENSRRMTERSGMHVDAFALIVRRPNGQTFEFLLDVSVCPDNSARMVKPA